MLRNIILNEVKRLNPPDDKPLTNILRRLDMSENYIEDIKYFWFEKEDVKRYSDWEKIQDKLREEYPALWFAFQQYHTMKQSIDLMLKGIDDYEL